MCSLFPRALALLAPRALALLAPRALALLAPSAFALAGLTACPVRAEVQAHVLRACADPNDLPFSNEREQGFENQIVRLIAADLGMELQYAWWAQRRGFIRNTLDADRCDVVAGVPAGYEPTLTTRPYYRSSYVALTRPDRGLRITSLTIRCCASCASA